MDEKLVALGTLFSGIASLTVIIFTILVFWYEKRKKKEFANYYLKRVRKRADRILAAIEKNCHDGKIHLSIHQTPRGFDDISKNGLDYSIKPDQEEAIEEFTDQYNNYLYDYWIDSNNKFKFHESDEAKKDINKASKTNLELLRLTRKRI